MSTATITHIVGARPNFMKAAPVLTALRAHDVAQRLVHTGQHYDALLSDVFFAELDLPAPDVNLGVGSGTQATQTAALLTGLEAAFTEVDPGLVVVYGDVNSTLAAALVAAKLGLRLAHVEAGLRSFDPTMPEEVNRRVTDALADLLLATSPEAIAHLAREGVEAGRIHLVGNPMIDSLVAARGRLDPDGERRRLGLPERYAVATLHRPANVDDPGQARRVVAALAEVGEAVEVLLPLHPRGRAALAEAGLDDAAGVRVVEPLGYVPFLSLVAGSALVVTDSGGVQEETTILDVACLTLRESTERPITLTHGTNRLVSAATLPDAAAAVLEGRAAFPTERPPLWDGRAGERIAALLAAEAAAGS